MAVPSLFSEATGTPTVALVIPFLFFLGLQLNAYLGELSGHLLVISVCLSSYDVENKLTDFQAKRRSSFLVDA